VEAFFIVLVLVGTALVHQVIGTRLGWLVKIGTARTAISSSSRLFALSSHHHFSFLGEDSLFCFSSIWLEFTIKDNIQPLNNVPRLEIWSV